MSEYDRSLHRTLFSDPAQVALVVDPASEDVAWFGWEVERIAPLALRRERRRRPRARPGRVTRRRLLREVRSGSRCGDRRWSLPVGKLGHRREGGHANGTGPVGDAAPSARPRRSAPESGDRRGEQGGRRAAQLEATQRSSARPPAGFSPRRRSPERRNRRRTRCSSFGTRSGRVTLCSVWPRSSMEPDRLGEDLARQSLARPEPSADRLLVDIPLRSPDPSGSTGLLSAERPANPRQNSRVQFSQPNAAHGHEPGVAAAPGQRRHCPRIRTPIALSSPPAGPTWSPPPQGGQLKREQVHRLVVGDEPVRVRGPAAHHDPGASCTGCRRTGPRPSP